MATLLQETAKKVLTPETLHFAAKQSDGCLVVPVKLRRAIKQYIKDQDDPHMKKKVLRLSESFSEIKDANLMLPATTSRELVDDPFKFMDRSKRWKIKSAYGAIGLEYSGDETVAYVASRMPAVFSACYRVFSEIRRRLPDFAPANMLDFGAGTGSAFWATREVWPKSMQKVNIVEPSMSMQRAGRDLIQGLKNLPLVHGYDSLLSLNRNIPKSEREHDLVIASYVLGEIPSLKDRITIVRQLWNLTRDVLVLIEPGTPHGSNIISQMRSHILWMENRKLRKAQEKLNESSKDLVSVKSGAFIVAPCPHDGLCPLQKSGKYCHFVQRLQRTSTQRAYKHSKGKPLRGFEDEKFSFVVFRRGQRPRQPWPLDGVKFDTFKEQLARRNLEDLEVNYESQIEDYQSEDVLEEEEWDPVNYDSDAIEIETEDDNDKDEGENEDTESGNEETVRADLGGGWGRIIYSPVRRGRQVNLNVCRSVSPDSSEGSFEHIVVTKNKNPALHRQARKSRWGDLWPC